MISVISLYSCKTNVYVYIYTCIHVNTFYVDTHDTSHDDSHQYL